METRIEERPSDRRIRFGDVSPGTWVMIPNHVSPRFRLQGAQYATGSGCICSWNPEALVEELELAGVDGQTLLLRRVGVRGDG